MFAFVLLGAALSILALLRPDHPGELFRWHRAAWIATTASVVAFLCACVLVARRPRVGYRLGLLGGLLALPLIVRNHWFTDWLAASWNPWIFLNADGSEVIRGGVPFFAEMAILATVLVVTVIATCAFRLLPARWSIRGKAIREHTWPPLAVASLVLVVWFVRSVTPYSVAAFDHSAHLEFRILHIEKRGLRFRETRIGEYRDGRVWIWRHDRRLFQYRSEGRVSVSALGEQSPATLARARSFVQSPALWNLKTPPPRALWSWNADGWYVVLKDSRVLAFTSEYGTAPPQEVVSLFHEIERLPSIERGPFECRDVSLGFSYDPVAALGFSVLRQRERLLSR